MSHPPESIAVTSPVMPPEVAALLRTWTTGPWWQRAAVESINRGWFTAIPGRNGVGLYLLRLWLVQPRMAPERDSWSSEQSVLLHWFRQADDDGSLHDHPWDFTTTILQGGYCEALPAQDWRACMGGPRIDEHQAQHYAGGSVVHRAEDLHAVATVCADTWTLVRTGQERRPWGFHPPGKAWVPWRDFLAEKRSPAAVTVRDPVNQSYICDGVEG
jgi:hypothetical protein